MAHALCHFIMPSLVLEGRLQEQCQVDSSALDAETEHGRRLVCPVHYVLILVPALVLLEVLRSCIARLERHHVIQLCAKQQRGRCFPPLTFARRGPRCSHRTGQAVLHFMSRGET
eukprot:2566868-Pleurochrysis_carterae.AAC.1